MSKVKPLSPEDITIELPDFVVEAVNAMIKKRYRGDSFTFKAKELLDLKEELELGPGDGTDWYKEKWMDFEDVFREAGWAVEYRRPDFTESFDAYYEFTPKKKK